jgi:hypothetical protein
MTTDRGIVQTADDRPILTKNRMYDMLSSGRLGNTVPMYFSVASWEASDDHDRYDVWAVRSLVPGGPCRLYCPCDEVAGTASSPEFRRAGVNISIMIDALTTVTCYMDVYDTNSGLVVRAVEYPGRGASWRKEMPQRGTDHKGVTAALLLDRHLNGPSREDLRALLERFPGHVVELSACARCIGTVPGRNAVVWEVRRY